MNRKELLKRELIAFVLGLIVFLFAWIRFKEKEILPEHFFIYLFFLFFISSSILIHYEEYTRKKISQIYKKEGEREKFFSDPGWVFLHPLIALPFFTKAAKILLKEYNIPSKAYLK